MAGWLRKTSWGGASGLALMEQISHRIEGPCWCSGWKVGLATPHRLGVGEKDAERGSPLSPLACLSWTLGGGNLLSFLESE